MVLFWILYKIISGAFHSSTPQDIDMIETIVIRVFILPSVLIPEHFDSYLGFDVIFFFEDIHEGISPVVFCRRNISHCHF